MLAPLPNQIGDDSLRAANKPQFLYTTRPCLHIWSAALQVPPLAPDMSLLARFCSPWANKLTSAHREVCALFLQTAFSRCFIYCCKAKKHFPDLHLKLFAIAVTEDPMFHANGLADITDCNKQLGQTLKTLP